MMHREMKRPDLMISQIQKFTKNVCLEKRIIQRSQNFTSLYWQGTHMFTFYVTRTFFIQTYFETVKPYTYLANSTFLKETYGD